MAQDPSPAEVMRLAIDNRLLDVHTALPGRVKSYDPDTQCADIQAMVMRCVTKRDGSKILEELPIIPNVPVGWIRGGGYWMQFPLNVGDFVILLFSEAAMAQWRESGELSEPGDIRRHDLSYPWALPCCGPNKDALEALDGDEAAIDGPTKIRIGGAATAALAARLGDTVEVLLPPAVFSGTIAGSPASGVLTFTTNVTTGTISAVAQNKVWIGG